MVAGFIGWILDVWKNEEEFPKKFLEGWWEGIWWSFISMTTVGYGDKSPKSIPARLFSIVWIFTGIVIFGIIAASLTTIVVEGSAEKPASMEGHRVGWMRDRIYEANVIAAKGGIRVPPTWCGRQDIIVFRLIEQLKEGEIDGFLLDRYAYWRWKDMMNNYRNSAPNKTTCDEVKHFLRETKDEERVRCLKLNYKQCRQGLLKYFHERTTRTVVLHSEGEAAYGIWMKNEDHYKFFRNAFRDNKMTFKIDLASSEQTNHLKDKSPESKFMDELYTDMDHYRYLCLISFPSPQANFFRFDRFGLIEILVSQLLLLLFTR